jgi:hypothetical protein
MVFKKREKTRRLTAVVEARSVVGALLALAHVHAAVTARIRPFSGIALSLQQNIVDLIITGRWWLQLFSTNN